MINDMHNSNGIERPNLDALLDRGLSNRLTLVVGPFDDDAGTALADWIERRSIAAVSIEGPEDTLTKPCLHQVVDAFIGAGIIASDALDLSSATNQAILVRLINELSALDFEIVFVIEHYAPSEASDCLLTFLLEHLPQQLHLYIFCESPPPLSCIPRLRVRRQLQTITTQAS